MEDKDTDKNQDEPDQKESLPDPQPKKPSSLTLMKKGDYSVHILIEEVKNCIQLDDNKQPFPIVKVTCFDKSKRTPKTDIGCTDYVFGEHFYFDKTNLTAEMLDSEKIIIEVYDARNTKRKDYYGINEFDFEYIYNNPGHAIHNLWLALANPESETITQVRGYLKVSMSVLHENDPRIELESKDADCSNCMVPSQIKMEYKQISIHFFRGEELPDMDSMFFNKKVNRECDGYIEVKYMGVLRKTKVVEMKNDIIEWNEIVDIPVAVPAVSQKIVMVVKDKDPTGFDIVGSIELKVDDIIKEHKYDDFTYLNIYGSPLNKKGKVYDQMNYNAEIGSKWKGRILVKITTTDVDAPLAQVRPIEDEALMREAYSRTRNNTWKIHYRIYSSLFLPEPKDAFGLRISIQDTIETIKSRNAKGRNIEWNVNGVITTSTLTDDINELPDIFIYLTDKKGDKEICFQRIKTSEFYLNQDVMYIKLIPDPAIGKVPTMMKAGLLKIKLGVMNVAKDSNNKDFNVKCFLPTYSDVNDSAINANDINDNDNDSSALLPDKLKRTGTQMELKPYTIVAIVYMSRQLIAADSDGTSDPFVELSLGEDTKKTSIKMNTINGIWNERLVYENVKFNLQDKSSWPVFLLQVIDYNKVLSNVPIGYNYIWLNNASYSLNDSTLVRPRWHNLFLPKSNKQQGQIMLSFYVLDDAHRQLLNKISYIPETVPFICEMNILGLRELKPLSVFPVKKAFIKFDMNSLNVTGRPEDALQPIVTVPCESGDSPTINTVIKFDARLPKDDIFIPDLQCEVYDHLLSGMMNSLLGVFTLDIKKIIKRTKMQIEEDLKVTKKTIGVDLARSIVMKNVIMKQQQQQQQQQQQVKGMTEDNEGEQKKEEQQIQTNVNDVALDISDEAKDEVLNRNNKPQGNKLDKNTVISLSNNFLQQSSNDSSFFVIHPVLKTYKVPGFNKKTPPPPSTTTTTTTTSALTPSNTTTTTTQNEQTELLLQDDANNNINNNNTRKSTDSQKIQKEFLIEDETKAPDSNLYFKVGYLLKPKPQDHPELNTEHYRRIYREPLENVKELKLKAPFNKAKLRRGKYHDKKSEIGLFEALSNINGKILSKYHNGEKVSRASSVRSSILSKSSLPSQQGFMGNNTDENEKVYGKFKGLLRICEKQKYEEYQKTIADFLSSKKEDERKAFKSLTKYDDLRKRILAKKNIVIRLYVLELNNLAKRDLLSESDPYIKIFLNNKEIINEKNIHQDDQKNCKWYKHYDIVAEIPGASALRLECWDYDDLLSDDLIGSTTIDIEDRYFDNKWQEMKEKPIEVRPLLHPDINGSQGEAYLWLEMFDSDIRNEKIPWSITPEPRIQMQLRFVVWETEDMELMDIEGTSDIYVIAYVNMKDKQSTDVHYRCQTGAGSFNWRMLLPIETPCTTNTLTIQVYDNDIFSSDDFISGASMNIKNLITIPKYLDLPIKFTREYYENLTPAEKEPYGNIEFETKEEDPEGIKFWVQCYKQNKEAGRVMCSMELLPLWKAELNKVGKGRDEPNLDPYLPPPVGRFEFSLNPFKMLNQCVGPKFRKGIYCGICILLIIVYLICFGPYLIYSVSGQMANPFNWIE